jgi:hypothetical protein
MKKQKQTKIPMTNNQKYNIFIFIQIKVKILYDINDLEILYDINGETY